MKIRDILLKVRPARLFRVRVKIPQPGYTQQIYTTVTAQNAEMARKLVRLQYGKNSLIGEPKEIK